MIMAVVNLFAAAFLFLRCSKEDNFKHLVLLFMFTPRQRRSKEDALRNQPPRDEAGRPRQQSRGWFCMGGDACNEVHAGGGRR